MNTLSSLKTWIRLILENEIDKTPNNAGVITPSIPQPKPKEDKPNVSKDASGVTKYLKSVLSDLEGEDDETKFYDLLSSVRNIGLTMLGAGSSRAAYELSDGNVIKVALNNAGRKQNEVEWAAGHDAYVSDLLAPLVKGGYGDGYWVIAKKVTPYQNISDLVDASGVSWNTFMEILGQEGEYQTPDVTPTKKGKEVDKKGKEFIDAVKGMVHTRRWSNLLPGDIGKVDSWGEYEGKPVLYDYGATRQIFDKEYDPGTGQIKKPGQMYRAYLHGQGQATAGFGAPQGRKKKLAGGADKTVPGNKTAPRNKVVAATTRKLQNCVK